MTQHGSRQAKDALFDALASVAKAMASGRRAEIVELLAQGERTVFQKLREAALAYHLTREWPKEKILTEYLNAIYFGNGAYGIESAARVYFGKRHGWGTAGGCGSTRANTCSSQLTTPEAAFLAGIIQGVVRGDSAGMLQMAVLRLPGAVLAMTVVIGITDLLLRATNEMSNTVLAGFRDDIEATTRLLGQVAATPGLSGAGQLLLLVFGGVGLLAAVVLVIELFVRAALIYIVVALSPLIYAAAVWEQMRGGVRKLAELGLALIVSKFVIAVALSLSAAALATPAVVAALPWFAVERVILFGAEYLHSQLGDGFTGTLLADIEVDWSIDLLGLVTIRREQPLKIRYKAIGLSLTNRDGDDDGTTPASAGTSARCSTPRAATRSTSPAAASGRSPAGSSRASASSPTAID